MFCPKCGSQVADGESFCSICGSQMDQPPVAGNQPAVDGNQPQFNGYQPESGSTYPGGEAAAKKKLNPKLIGIIACSAALVIVLIVVLSLVLGGGGSPESAAKEYILGELDFDYDTHEKYSLIDPKDQLLAYYQGDEDEMNEYLEDEYDTTDYKKVYEGEYRDDAIDDFEDKFGKDYDIKIEDIESDEISSKKTKDMIKTLDPSIENVAEALDVDEEDIFDTKKIDTIYEVKGEINIKGEDDKGSYDFKIYMAKVGGKWKVVSGYIPKSADAYD